MMYKKIIRQFLFLINPEKVHGIVNFMLKTVFSIPGFRRIVHISYQCRNKKLERQVFGIKFRNPVGLAAGFDKNGRMLKEYSTFDFAFIETGTVTPNAQKGNKKPRLFRLVRDHALINRMGFNNQGAEKVAERLKDKPSGIVIGGNIGKNTSTPNDRAAKDYVYCFRKLYDVVDYFVVNISCPNIGDISELHDKASLRVILSSLLDIRKNMEVKKPILVKVSPDFRDDQIDDAIEVVNELGIEGFVATNTTVTRPVRNTGDLELSRAGDGGLSGLPLRERSTEVIRYIHEKTGGKLPIIGVGGIMGPGDALEKLEAGACLVQIYTGFIYEGPGLVKRINKYLIRNT